MEGVEMFDFKKRERMEADTDAYLDDPNVRKAVNDCLAVMELLPVREPGLLDSRHDEGNVYSRGEDESAYQKLAERLGALRM